VRCKRWEIPLSEFTAHELLELLVKVLGVVVAVCVSVAVVLAVMSLGILAAATAAGRAITTAVWAVRARRDGSAPDGLGAGAVGGANPVDDVAAGAEPVAGALASGTEARALTDEGVALAGASAATAVAERPDPAQEQEASGRGDHDDWKTGDTGGIAILGTD
jgi:hypothetical protein